MIEIIPNWHPLFVHFTVALISVSTFCFILGRVLKEKKTGKELLIVARWSLWFGGFAAVATVAAGFYAYYTVAHDTPSHIAMTVHRNWAIATLIVILSCVVWSFKNYKNNVLPPLIFIGAMIISSCLVTITAWHGAELVYRYGIGVLSLPESTGQGHQHDHSKKETKQHEHGTHAH